MHESDVTPAYVAALNDPEVHRFLVGPRSRRQTPELVRSFVRQNLEDAAALFFGLFVKAELKGTVRLHDIGGGRAFLGIVILDRSLWGRGWGRRCVAAVTRFACTTLGLARVSAVIEPENGGSIRAFERAGYRLATGAERSGTDPAKQLWVFEAVNRVEAMT